MNPLQRRVANLEGPDECDGPISAEIIYLSDLVSTRPVDPEAAITPPPRTGVQVALLCVGDGLGSIGRCLDETEEAFKTRVDIHLAELKGQHEHPT